MIKIEAVIRPERLKPVKEALTEIGINAMTIYNVKGRGEQAGLEFTARTGLFRIDELPKVKIEIVVEDQDEEKVVDSILLAARTGEMGDGKIFVTPVHRAVKIRTGDEWRYS